jgi:hypothetical protein
VLSVPNTGEFQGSSDPVTRRRINATVAVHLQCTGNVVKGAEENLSSLQIARFGTVSNLGHRVHGKTSCKILGMTDLLFSDTTAGRFLRAVAIGSPVASVVGVLAVVAPEVLAR